ncbi:MAG: PIG-L family deacetylase [Verrucomicrobiota bacterium]|nr:PIG-L family deacetylase [Verrucomicrobiota bacterium]
MLSPIPQLNRASRLLFFAPHPDDESLAGGGLLQKAAAAGAAIEVICVTNGDDNPWPLRLMERQWKIDSTDHALWGLRRMQETLDALCTLGLARNCVQFLNLPDQQLTRLLLQETALVRQLREIIRRMSPTLLVGPTPNDRHPDHSALSVLLELALNDRSLPPLRRLAYAVHTRGHSGNDDAVAFSLNRDEQETKRRAVLCHRSQMLLSRRRFLRHVRDREEFWAPAPPCEMSPEHSVIAGRFEDGSLHLQLRRQKRTGTFARCSLQIVGETDEQEQLRWELQLPGRSTNVEVRAANGLPVGAQAAVQIRGAHAAVQLPLAHFGRPQGIFVKLKEPTLFFDRSGWREIPVRLDRTLEKSTERSAAFTAHD